MARLEDAAALRYAEEQAAAKRSLAIVQTAAPSAAAKLAVASTGAEAEATFLVDNSQLRSDTQGLGYRLSKRLDHVEDKSTAMWDSTVEGIDESDGWVRVGQRFLPMQIRGVTVLTILTTEEAVVLRKAVEEESNAMARLA